jgi:hypothetical protein
MFFTCEFSFRFFQLFSKCCSPIDAARIKNLSTEKAINDAIASLPANKPNVTHSDKVNILTSVFNNSVAIKTGKEAMDVCQICLLVCFIGCLYWFVIMCLLALLMI